MVGTAQGREAVSTYMKSRTAELGVDVVTPDQDIPHLQLVQRRLTLQGAGPALLLTCQATDPPEVHSKEPNLGRGEAISLLSNVKYGHSMTQQKPYCSDLKHSCNRCHHDPMQLRSW